MMNANDCEDSGVRSSTDLVQVNGSFYCNLSLRNAEPELEWDATGHDVFHPHSSRLTKRQAMDGDSGARASGRLSNGANRTVVRIGDPTARPPSAIEEAQGQDGTAARPGPSGHTIKLVIGEPFSLDTCHHVSWDASPTAAGSAASAGLDDDDIDDDDIDDDDIEPSDSDDEDEGRSDGMHWPADLISPPSASPTSRLGRHLTADDELAHSCCRFFDQRQQKLASFVSTSRKARPASTPDAATLAADSSAAQSPVPALNAKMDHLRMEIVSLVNQDDALFRQLLALNTSIGQLRSQSLERRGRTLPTSRSRSQLSPTLNASLTSLISLTSLSDGEDVEVEGDDSDREPTRAKPVRSSLANSRPTCPASAPATGQAVAGQQLTLTRKRVSYPPKSRHRSQSQLSRCSFNSSSSSSSSSSCSSTTCSPSPTWSLSSVDAKATVKGVRTPRSPHSSFYSRSSSKNPPLSARQRWSNSQQSDLLVVFHKRQGSYDSGCQGSEPSDAEVFV